MITTEKLLDESIIVQSYDSSYNMATDGHDAIATIRSLLDQHNEPMYLIIEAQRGKVGKKVPTG